MIGPGYALALALTGGGAPAHDALGADERLWTAWSLDPFVLIPAGLLALLYVRGLRRWRGGRAGSHHWWQTAYFALGLGTLVLALVSPLDRLAEHHFSMHMVQHLLLIAVGTPLLLLGAPTTPVLRGLPRWARRLAARPLAPHGRASVVWRTLTQPLVALVLANAALIAWHLVPGWYDAAVRDDGIHALEHATFTGAALLFWWNVIDPRPLHAPLGYLARMGYVLVAGTAQSVIAALITLADYTLYPVYEDVRLILPIEPRADQELGGLIMWIPGQALNLIVLAALFGVWAVRSELAQQEAEQRALTAAEPPRAAPPATSTLN
ncbi:MAG: cytochrome c oxidase assembly protein [Dehalococcoidia bacterium]|nr:cytochrome c oxidase assembly protein [Dehalococcoidia bacterium]